jgi:hypothetical protein
MAGAPTSEAIGDAGAPSEMAWDASVGKYVPSPGSGDWRVFDASVGDYVPAPEHVEPRPEPIEHPVVHDRSGPTLVGETIKDAGAADEMAWDASVGKYVPSPGSGDWRVFDASVGDYVPAPEHLPTAGDISADLRTPGANATDSESGLPVSISAEGVGASPGVLVDRVGQSGPPRTDDRIEYDPLGQAVAGAAMTGPAAVLEHGVGGILIEGAAEGLAAATEADEVESSSDGTSSIGEIAIDPSTSDDAASIHEAVQTQGDAPHGEPASDANVCIDPSSTPEDVSSQPSVHEAMHEEHSMPAQSDADASATGIADAPP